MLLFNFKFYPVILLTLQAIFIIVVFTACALYIKNNWKK